MKSLGFGEVLLETHEECNALNAAIKTADKEAPWFEDTEPSKISYYPSSFYAERNQCCEACGHPKSEHRGAMGCKGITDYFCAKGCLEFVPWMPDIPATPAPMFVEVGHE